MQPGTHEFARTRFGLNWSTFIFIILSITTCGAIFLIWIWNFANRISSAHARRTNRVLVILYFALVSWGPLLFQPHRLLYILDRDAYYAWMSVTMAFVIPGLVLLIILSFRTKAELERMLAENGMPQSVNGVLCFFFPFLPQYYVVWNAEDRYYRQQMVMQAYAQAQQAAPYGAPHQQATYPQQYAQPQQHAQQQYQQPSSQPTPQPQGAFRNIPSPPPPAPSPLAAGAAAAVGAAAAGAAASGAATGGAGTAEPAAASSGLDLKQIVKGARKAYSAFRDLTAHNADNGEEVEEEEDSYDDEEQEEEYKGLTADDEGDGEEDEEDEGCDDEEECDDEE